MNIYKTLTFLLSVAVIVLAYLYFQDRPDETATQTPQKTKEFEDFSELETAYLELTELLNTSDKFDTTVFFFFFRRSTGKNLTLQQAIDKMDRFRQWNSPGGPGGKPKISPFAFAFGFDKIQTLIDESNDYNNGLPSEDSLKTITGTRLYLTITRSRSVSGRMEPHLDLIFVPVLRSGNDYISLDIDKGGDGDPMILNNSTPCPDLCDD